MGSDRRSRRGATEGELRVGWRMGGLGMQVASEAGAGALLGWLFDWWRGTAPTGLLVGAVIGIVVALWSLIRGGLKLNRDLDRETARRRSVPPADDNEADG
ncbi:MAG: AtpZ/AtpI family protein [Planctomycetota bacterium]